MAEQDRKSPVFTRRRFLTIAGAGALGTAAAGSTALGLQYLWPNVLFEPPTEFRVGRVSDFNPGSITLLPKHKIFVARPAERIFYAMSAVCTHLGCITNWCPQRKVVACPCHGSLFDRDGKVIQGPAPRDLPHLRIYKGRDELLWVSRAEKVSPEEVLDTASESKSEEDGA